VRREVK